MPVQKLSFSEILVRGGMVPPEKMTAAERRAAQEGIPLAEAVVRLGLASEEQVAMARSKELGVPYASRENQILKPESGQGLERVIDERFARESLVVPLFVEGNTLAVAMADPTNVMTRDNVKLMSNMDIQPFIATKAQLLATIDQFYGGSGNLIETAIDSSGSGARAAEGDVEVDLSDAEGKLNLDRVASGKSAHVVNLVNAVMKQAIAEKASDIHLESFDERASLRFRIDGVLYDRASPRREDFLAIISRIKILSKLDIAERRLPQDGTFSILLQNRTIEVRVSTLPAVFGEKVVMRLMDRGKVDLSIDRLGFEPKQREDFLKAAKSPHGLIFLTGPTGSGKTTTLYSVMSTIKSVDKNYMTIEDPVEIKMDGVSQCQVKPQIGLTYAAAIRAFLRQDPDVILVGEVRDQETAQTCLRAALTGHLVLSTLHTNDAMGAVARLIDLGIEPYLLANSLLLSAAQRLVRMLCPKCKTPYRPDAATADMIIKESMVAGLKPEQIVLHKAVGCDACSRTGFSGRKAIYEVYRISDEMRDIIYRSGDTKALKDLARKQGLIDMRAGGWRKAMMGLTTAQEVQNITMV